MMRWDMEKLCFLGCLDAPSTTVDALIIKSAILAFQPGLLLFADSTEENYPWGEALLGLTMPILNIDLSGENERLKRLGFLAEEAQALDRLARLGARGLLPDSASRALEEIAELRAVYRDIFDATLKQQNERHIRERVLSAERRVRGILIQTLEGLPGGAERCRKLAEIQSASDERRRSLLRRCGEALSRNGGSDGRGILVMASIPDAATLREAASRGRLPGAERFALAEFWE